MSGMLIARKKTDATQQATMRRENLMVEVLRRDVGDDVRRQKHSGSTTAKIFAMSCSRVEVDSTTGAGRRISFVSFHAEGSE